MLMSLCRQNHILHAPACLNSPTSIPRRHKNPTPISAAQSTHPSNPTLKKPHVHHIVLHSDIYTCTTTSGIIIRYIIETELKEEKKIAEELQKVETEPTPAPEPPLAAVPDVTPEKEKLPTPPGAVDDSKALAVVEPEKVPEAVEKKPSGGSHDRDVALEKLEKEKSMSFVRAWEDSEKDKAENKAEQKLSTVTAWENTKKAAIEAKLRSMEEKLEKKKAQYGEQMKNQIGALHKQAEEKKAMIQAERGRELLKAEEMAAKYRATGGVPKKFLGCF